MMWAQCIAGVAGAWLLVASAVADDARLLRFPDVHEDKVVFTYGGDLWLASTEGGTAQRLTSHPGLELFAKFSPDGQTIAFTGQYGGDEQVYVIPAAGGEPQQLTYYPATGPLPARWGYDNQVYGWHPDGERVLFRSRRDAWGSSSATLYTVGKDGGMAEKLPVPVAGAGTFAGDSGRLLYSPLFRDFRTWKRYEGGWAQDLWMIDLASGKAEAITEHPRTERDPMWINGQAYFVSDRSGTLNVYRLDADSNDWTALTQHSDGDVRWASSDDVGQIVYELNGGLRLLDIRNAEDRAIALSVPNDGLNRRPRVVDVSDQVNDARLSPTGQRVLFSARGNLFSAPVEHGVTQRLTERSTAHDREVAWSPDGQHVYFVSDSSGEEQLYALALDGSSEPVALTDELQTRLYELRVSPDGERIAFSDKDGQIFIIDRGGDNLTQVARDQGWRNRDYTWAPDGQWLAFSLTEPTGLRALHVYSVDDEETTRISQGLFSESEPAFSPDGQYLYFLGDREFAPQIGGREWNYSVNRATRVLGMALTANASHPFAPRNAVEPGINAQDEEVEDTSGSDDVEVEIDFDGLAQRVFTAPIEPDNYTGLAVTQDALWVMATSAFYYGRSGDHPPQLKRFSLKERKLENWGEGVQPVDLSADGKHVLARVSGAWQVLPLDKGGADGKPVSTGGLHARIDPVAEWHTAFDEVWRRFRDHFYVENMHGYDWEALREQYRPLVRHAGHRSDLNYIMGEMIAELNVSHAYVSGGDLGLPERPNVALLGARFELDERSGRYRIASILEGQNDEPRYRSPLTQTGVDAQVGDYLLAINGRSIRAEDNLYQRLTLPADEPLMLTLADRADGRGQRDVLVDPISDETALYYLAWVTANHRRVTEATDGRVGYLHIPDMGPTGVREFIKWFYGQLRKDGLVIDVRSNGGGNVSQMLIERLSRRPLSLGYSRTVDYVSTYPAQAFNGKLVALLDENSASDGDIFPWQFRNAGLGPLIGKKSWGGVVGITNHGPLIDGGSVNVPEFGFSDTEGEYVIEGEGVTPDIEVSNDPASVLAGRDPQLERGIEEVLKRIDGADTRFPPRPEAPVKLN
jgi:tricorn protease